MDWDALPDETRAMLRRMAMPDYEEWDRQIRATGGCSNPIRLRGGRITTDAQTGEVLDVFHTDASPVGYLLIPCGNRRADVCPSCSEVYRWDAYQLIRAGLAGGKGVPETVTLHPALFVTLTAPSFGPVHARHQQQGKDGAPLRCRPRRDAKPCAHGVVPVCHDRHERGDAIVGQAFCVNCYDYIGTVLFNAHAGILWRRLSIYLRRALAKVAMDRALRAAIGAVRLEVPDPLAAHETRVVRFGRQIDTQVIHASAAERAEGLTSSAVAGYIAKYATKAAEATGTPAGRIRHERDINYLRLSDHASAMIRACFLVGRTPGFEYVNRSGPPTCLATADIAPPKAGATPLRSGFSAATVGRTRTRNDGPDSDYPRSHRSASRPTGHSFNLDCRTARCRCCDPSTVAAFAGVWRSDFSCTCDDMDAADVYSCWSFTLDGNWEPGYYLWPPTTGAWVGDGDDIVREAIQFLPTGSWRRLQANGPGGVRASYGSS